MADLFSWRLLLAAILALAGCVERTLVVDTDPPGAQVYLDEELVRNEDGSPASTPVEIPFIFYGGREVLVRREGSLSEKRMVEVDPPAYELFPLDFFAENLIPYTFEDVHRVRIEMRPAPPPTGEARDELLRRAEEFRRLIPVSPGEEWPVPPPPAREASNADAEEGSGPANPTAHP
ncbi:MAG: PEGA domain-containing protein [Planctomycetes bacterium]|nr:PEGA domain-containing protein [Planctomycetota bacterium]